MNTPYPVPRVHRSSTRLIAMVLVGVAAGLPTGLVGGWLLAPAVGWAAAAILYITWVWFVVARMDADGFTFAVTASTPAPRVFAFAAVPSAAELAAAVETCDWYDDAHGAPDWRRATTLRFAEELRAEAAS